MFSPSSTARGDSPEPRNPPPSLLRAAAALLLLALAGCGGSAPAPDRFSLTIGSFGHTAGKFNRPRGLVFNETTGVLFVVDWDGRIQKFTPEGEFLGSWIMPAVEKGKPEDLCLTTNGNLLVTDTHYSRIVEFAPGGELIRSFGSYGREPGQFIYPVGICSDREGNIYVSEYGENDRIQKFAADGTWLLSWGRFGTAPGEFQRPSGIDLSPDNELFVADAVNHRIQVFDGRGGLLRVIGGEGAEPGKFRYPYDVAVSSNALYVLEFGNQRVQKLTKRGDFIAMLGQPGRGDGCFASPWRCTMVRDALYVSDTDNSRVVRLNW
jgi:iron(III) transport system ATP-binding protein